MPEPIGLAIISPCRNLRFAVTNQQAKAPFWKVSMDTRSILRQASSSPRGFGGGRSRSFITIVPSNTKSHSPKLCRDIVSRFDINSCPASVCVSHVQMYAPLVTTISDRPCVMVNPSRRCTRSPKTTEQASCVRLSSPVAFSCKRFTRACFLCTCKARLHDNSTRPKCTQKKVHYILR